MTTEEFVAAYVGGIVLQLFSLSIGRGDIVTVQKHEWIGWVVTTLGWPLLIPISCYALIGNIIFAVSGRLLPWMEDGDA